MFVPSFSHQAYYRRFLQLDGIRYYMSIKKPKITSEGRKEVRGVHGHLEKL